MKLPETYTITLENMNFLRTLVWAKKREKPVWK